MNMVTQQASSLRVKYNLKSNDNIPADMLLSSASGLDPDISIENAMIQAPVVAAARKINLKKVVNLIQNLKESPLLGCWEIEMVNAVKLNVALDNLK